MKTPKLFTCAFLLCLLCMGMGFPRLITRIDEYQEPDNAYKPEQFIQELPISNSSIQQKNSCSFSGCSLQPVCFSLLSKLLPMNPYPQWVQLPYQSMYNLTQVSYFSTKKMSHINNTFPVWIVLQSLLLFTTPSLAQVKTERKAMEAAIYVAHENPFWIYVRLENPQRRMVSVSLSTDNNKILFTDWTTKYKYNIRLNLSDLPNGEYRVRVTDQRKVVNREISIRTLYEQKTQRMVSLSDRAGY